MLKNPLTIIITVVVIAAIVIGLQFIDGQEKASSSAIKAVPEDAAIVFETANFNALLKNFNKGNFFRQEFSELPELSNFFAESDFLDSLFGAHLEFQTLTTENRIMISGHPAANNNTEFLYIIPISEKKSTEYINKTISDIVGNDATIRQRLYEGFTIFDVVFFRDEIKTPGFSYSFANGLYILSFSRIQIEASLRRLTKEYSLANDKSFSRLMESAGKNVDANLYINYKYLPNILKNIFKTGNAEFYDFISGFASWTELDLIMKNDAFLMSGFTYTDDSLNHYLNVIKSQASLKNQFLESFPGNTASFIAFNISDTESWKSAYFTALHRSGEYPRISNEIERFEAKYGKGKSKTFYGNIEGGLAMVWTNNQLKENQQECYGIISLKDDELMKAELEHIQKQDSTGKGPQVLEQFGGITVYHFPEPSMLSVFYGKAFKQLDASYCIIYKGYLVFGASVQSLQNYLRNTKPGQKLTDDKNFELYSKSISSESNLFVYANIAGSKNILSSELNSKFLGIFDKNFEKFSKIQALSLQFSSGKQMLSTNLFMGFNPRVKKSGKNEWEIALDAPIGMKPQIVKSHLGPNNEIIVQDGTNQLMLISETGKVLWKKKLSGQILGEIHQVDLFKNNKYQFLFNTKEFLYLVDRNGKDVEDYPIKLKSPATNGMAVFDYDKDRTYRMLIACENRNVYLLNTKGGKVDGWVFGQTESEVNLPAKHFVSDGKDYIIFGDKMNTYIVNRKGETRVNVKSRFEKGLFSGYFFEKGESEKDDRFVTTGANGDVYFIFLDGVVKKMAIKEFSANHGFIYSDIDGDGKNQFIFADKNRLYIFNRDKSVKFEKKFDGDISQGLNIYSFSKKTRFIGLAPEGTGQLFLINAAGQIVKGFPLNGSGAFSIARIMANAGSNEYNLITGSPDGYLLNYKLTIDEQPQKPEI